MRRWRPSPTAARTWQTGSGEPSARGRARRTAPPVLTAVVFIVFIALVFDFINGFHDAANSIATVVSTRVLTPLQAVVWAAFFNFVAAFGFGVSVARTVGKGVVETTVVDQWVILAGLIGAIVWDLTTWVWGLPTSSSHALIGGFAGDQRVRGARRQAPHPRGQVPDDRADQTRQDHPLIHHRGLDDTLSDRARHAHAEAERGDEVEERRPDDRLERRQHAGRHDRGDRVRGVVETVDEVEDERDEDDEDDEGEHRSGRGDHAILRIIPSITLATSSHRSVTISIVS